MHTVFKGSASHIVFAGDLIPGTAWVHLPITMGYDRFAEMVIDEKEKLYQTIVSQGWLLFYTHDAATASSRIRKDEKGKYLPADAIKVLNKFTL